MSRKVLEEIILKNGQDCEVMSPDRDVVRGVRKSTRVGSLVDVVSSVDSDNLSYQDGCARKTTENALPLIHSRTTRLGSELLREVVLDTCLTSDPYGKVVCGVCAKDNTAVGKFICEALQRTSV